MLKDNPEYIRLLDEQAKENTWEARASELDKAMMKVVSQKKCGQPLRSGKTEIETATVIIHRDNLWNYLNQTTAEKETLSSQLSRILANDFWKVAGLY